MWKYLLICSVGIAFAFIGTIFAAASIQSGGGAQAEALFWTRLAAPDAHLDPTLMKFAFVFILVGYGTKAGLAPIHSWLPDAHSQAPAPVSAMFSGFPAEHRALLHHALRAAGAERAGQRLRRRAAGVLRRAVDPGRGRVHRVSARRQAVPRLSAASSISASSPSASGWGRWARFAALFHTLNHSLSQIAGVLRGRAGSGSGSAATTWACSSGALRADRLWGLALLGSILALIGAAPFAIFMSEYQLLRAAVGTEAWVVLVAVPRRRAASSSSRRCGT